MQINIATANRVWSHFWNAVGHAGRVKLLYEVAGASLGTMSGGLTWLAGVGAWSIVIGVLIYFIFSVSVYLRSMGAFSRTHIPDFMRNILINASSPDSPALLSGTASETFDKITLFLDYSAYFGDAIWSQRLRIKLASFNPFEKGIRYEAVIFSRTLEREDSCVKLGE
jgi:hypothetical protein